jgi:glyoxylase-like metal-dependent hydrolase (beta-lactamase superfamily II)
VTPPGPERAVHRFTVGDFRCAAINDGTFFYTAAQYFNDAPSETLASALAERSLAPERIPSPYTCLFVDTGDHLVVVDTGGDRAALQNLMPPGVVPDVGRFAESLAQAGVDPRDVDPVIITHAHPDHIGGNADRSGAPFFPNASIALRREEWAYWTSESTLAAQPPLYADPVRRHLLPFADRVELIAEDREIVPGIHVLHAPGHTPGHMAVAVQSGGEELLYISDAALHPLLLEHPDWGMTFDLDPATALASRRVLFDRAAERDALVLAFHFDPFPSLGRVTSAGAGWRWHPIEPSP